MVDEQRVQFFAVGQARCRIRCASIERNDMHLHAAAIAVELRLPIALANQQPAEPGFEPIWVAQRGEVASGGDERLLGRVLGALGVGDDQPGNGVELVDREACKLRERHCPDHEIPLHRVSGLSRRTSSCSQPMGGCKSKRFQTVPESIDAWLPAHALPTQVDPVGIQLDRQVRSLLGQIDKLNGCAAEFVSKR
jgi:hypothetical protein